MGMFDDLIPQGGPNVALNAPATDPFADLIPQAKDEPQQPQLPTAIDVAGGINAGIRRGFEGLAEIPGQLKRIQGDLVDLALERAGIDAETRAKVRPFAEAIHGAFPGIPAGLASGGAPVAGEVSAAADGVLGKPHEPQTVAGKFARTIGEFAPAAVAGPGGVVRKAAMAAIPGAASEAAGMATEGTAAEPFARAGGALVGGLAAAGRGVGQGAQAARAAREAPSANELTTATRNLYGRLTNAGIQFEPQAYRSAVKKLGIRLRKGGHRAITAPKAFGLFDELVSGLDKSLDFDDLDSIRKAFGKLVRESTDKSEKAVAGSAIDAIDNFIASGRLTAGNGMPRHEVAAMHREARSLAARNIKARLLEEAIENAGSHSAGIDAGIKREFNKLVNSQRRRQRFSKAEIAAITDVAGGNLTRRALAALGKFGFDLGKLGNNASFLPTTAGLGAGAMLDPVTGLALVGAGSGAKVGSRLLTQRAADNAVGAVRAGSNVVQRVNRQARGDNLAVHLRRLVGLDAARRSSE